MVNLSHQRLQIISEAQANGVSATCKKHKISRTLYYRWLKRYQSQGLDGLEHQKKSFIPANKISLDVEASVLDLIRAYPAYGPRAIKYLLEEIGQTISESAVYNIMKRHKLTRKEHRMKFARKRLTATSVPKLALAALSSGECWVFWIVDLGEFEGLGRLCLYTFMDLKSRVACTRLYDDIQYDYFEDLMNAVALPVAQTLGFDVKYLCLSSETKLLDHGRKAMTDRLSKTIDDNGYQVELYWLGPNEGSQIIDPIRNTYTKGCLEMLVPVIGTSHDYDQLKIAMQHHVRDYNISVPLDYDGEMHTPIGYHSKITGQKQILPLWAYLDRQY